MPPQPYAITELGVPGRDGTNFMTQLVYLGQEGGVLRIQYREFEDDRIRQAFTQELTVPLALPPAVVRIKGVSIEILKNSGGELTYRLTAP